MTFHAFFRCCIHLLKEDYQQRAFFSEMNAEKTLRKRAFVTGGNPTKTNRIYKPAKIILD